MVSKRYLKELVKEVSEERVEHRNFFGDANNDEFFRVLKARKNISSNFFLIFGKTLCTL